MLEMGITAGGKRYSDALMVLNLRSALDLIILGIFYYITNEISETCGTIYFVICFLTAFFYVMIKDFRRKLSKK